MKNQLVMSELHIKILAAIPKGRESARPLKHIVEDLALKSEDMRKAYSIVHDLIHRFNCPIGGSSDEDTKGVFIIMDEEDLKIACRTLNSRAVSMLERSRKIVENFNIREQEELKLNEDEDNQDGAMAG